MVQIIQENLRQRQPSTMDRFAQAFANAGQSASQVIPEYMMQKQNQQLQDQRQQAQNASLGKLSGMDFNSIQDPKLRQIMLQSALKEQELEKGRQHDVSMQAQKLMGQKSEKMDDSWKETAQNAYNQMASIWKEGRLGRTSGVRGFFGGQTAQDTGKFTSLSGALEAALVDQVSRGSLSNERFQYITKNLLPTATDNEDTIKGKLEGLAEILGLDSSALSSEAHQHEEMDVPSQSKPLDDKTMQEIYKKSGGNKEKAKRIARKMGYKL